MTFDDDVEKAIAVACEELEMTRDELIRLIIREWMEQYGFLPSTSWTKVARRRGMRERSRHQGALLT
jgi:hypothetical protein